VILASLLLLGWAGSLAAPKVSLTITPRFASFWSGTYATIRYTVFIPTPTPGQTFCTGWQFPVGPDPYLWEFARSCREVSTRSTYYIEWGGPRPLPYVGEYIAFVEYGPDRITSKFVILDSIPPPGG
jgi:hypothetical protein